MGMLRLEHPRSKVSCHSVQGVDGDTFHDITGGDEWLVLRDTKELPAEFICRVRVPLDFDAAVGWLPEGHENVMIGPFDGEAPCFSRGVWIGAGQVFLEIAGTVAVGVCRRKGVGRIAGAEMVDLPLGESTVGGQVAGDPASDQSDRLGIDQGRIQGWHLPGTACGNAREEHRMRGISGHNDSIGWIPIVTAQKAIDEPSGR